MNNYILMRDNVGVNYNSTVELDGYFVNETQREVITKSILLENKITFLEKAMFYKECIDMYDEVKESIPCLISKEHSKINVFKKICKQGCEDKGKYMYFFNIYVYDTKEYFITRMNDYIEMAYRDFDKLSYYWVKVSSGQELNDKYLCGLVKVDSSQK